MKIRFVSPLFTDSKIWKYVPILILIGLSACNPQIESPFRDEHRVKAEEIFNPTGMTVSLENILLWHQTVQTEIPAALNPGKTRDGIMEAFADLPCQPTEELIHLWMWHNGTKDVLTPFIWYHNFLPVEKAKSEYQWLIQNPLVGWQENWIPIFEFEGEWYFVECYETIKLASPVGHFFLEDTEAYYTYLSLSRMLETSTVYFEQNALIWDEGMVEEIRQVFEIHQTLNKGAQFPYHVE